jgi:hypothetical protein
MMNSSGLRPNDWLALASATALASLVAVAGVVGCSSTEEVVTESDPTQSAADAGKPRPTRDAAATPPDEEEVEPETCKDAKATFVPKEAKPTAEGSSTACTEKTIQALADACLADPSAKACTDARQLFTNKTCAECIFTESGSEPEWKVFVIDPPAFNQRGCIDHVTGVKGCGRELGNLVFIPDGCLEAFCGQCSESEQDGCFRDVLENECKEHLLSQACASALQSKGDALNKTCFGDPQIGEPAEQAKDLFVKMAKAACMKSSGGKDGG